VTLFRPLKKIDWFLIAGIIAAVALGLRFVPAAERLALSMIFALILSITTIGLIAFRKLQYSLERLNADSRQRDISTFRQMEAISGIYATVPTAMPFPPTRGYAVSPDLLAVIQRIIQSENPGLIIELGSGTSSVFMAQLLANRGNGVLFSVEHDEHHSRRVRSLLSTFGLTGIATVVECPLENSQQSGEATKWYDLGPLRQALETHDEHRQIDLLLVDGPPGTTCALARYPALHNMIDLLADDAIVILDDARRPDERRVAELWMREHPDFSAEYLPLEKGAWRLDRNDSRDKRKDNRSEPE